MADNYPRFLFEGGAYPNDEIWLWGGAQVAQDFICPYDCKVDTIAVQVSYRMPEGNMILRILKAKPNGQPTGGVLAQDSWPMGRWKAQRERRWRRFKRFFINLEAGEHYVLVVLVTWVLWIEWAKVGFLSEGNYFPTGHMMYSEDNGATWEHRIGADLVFSILAWRLPPPTPELPPPPNILETAEESSPLPEPYKTVIHTDRPCKATLVWTRTEPKRHQEPQLKRGLYKNTLTRFCFTGTHRIDQEEPGYTLTHTYIWAPWPVCETRWWYFIYSTAGDTLISQSPIHSFHMTEEVMFTTMKHTDLTHKEVDGIIDHAPGSITPSKLNHPFVLQNFLWTPEAAPTEDYQIANKKYVDDQAGVPVPYPEAYNVFDCFFESLDGWEKHETGIGCELTRSYVQLNTGDTLHDVTEMMKGDKAAPLHRANFDKQLRARWVVAASHIANNCRYNVRVGEIGAGNCLAGFHLLANGTDIPIYAFWRGPDTEHTTFTGITLAASEIATLEVRHYPADTLDFYVGGVQRVTTDEDLPQGYQMLNYLWVMNFLAGIWLRVYRAQVWNVL